jgi:hypothetical protein
LLVWITLDNARGEGLSFFCEKSGGVGLVKNLRPPMLLAEDLAGPIRSKTCLPKWVWPATTKASMCGERKYSMLISVKVSSNDEDGLTPANAIRLAGQKLPRRPRPMIVGDRPRAKQLQMKKGADEKGSEMCSVSFCICSSLLPLRREETSTLHFQLSWSPLFRPLLCGSTEKRSGTRSLSSQRTKAKEKQKAIRR